MAARRTRKKKPEPGSVGLSVAEMGRGTPPPELLELEERIGEAEGALLGRYRDPLGGRWLALAALPLARVAPTPFQRDLSEAHAKRLEGVIEAVGCFLDPIVAVPVPETARAEAGAVRFWTPNGLHRLSALSRLGARTITALISPDPALAYRILALNTEKAHNLKERALEAVRMARGLAEIDPKRPESAYALELQEGFLVTLGFAYEKRRRFAGGAYGPALKPSDGFGSGGLAQSLSRREARAERLLGIDDRVTEIVKLLKDRGFDSPYLKNFVAARIRPFRPRGKPAPGVDALLDHMEKAVAKFDVGRIKPDQVARTAGGSED